MQCMLLPRDTQLQWHIEIGQGHLWHKHFYVNAVCCDFTYLEKKSYISKHVAALLYIKC